MNKMLLTFLHYLAFVRDRTTRRFKAIFILVFFGPLTCVYSKDLFFGAQGNLNFPTFESSKSSGGFGGGAMVEGGFDINALQITIALGYDGTGSGGRIKSLREVKFGAGLGYSFDKRHFSFMPSFLSLRPELLASLDLYSGTVYQSKYKKSTGQSKDVFGLGSAFTFLGALEFTNIINLKGINLVPYIAPSQTLRPEDKGFLSTFALSFGLRTYFNKHSDSPGTEVSSLYLTAEPVSKLFSPDGDGKDDEAIIKINTDVARHGGAKKWELKVFDPGKNIVYSKTGKGKIPESVVWNGRVKDGSVVQGATVYQYVLTLMAKDGTEAVVPGLIETDVMVTKAGEGVYNIVIPSITFAPDRADFSGIGEDENRRNNELFDKAAQIIKNYPGYKVKVEGHAHNVSGTEEENQSELIPLSKKRAETVIMELAKRGIEKNRMKSLGAGSSKMLSKDGKESWKNRRVELILEKE